MRIAERDLRVLEGRLKSSPVLLISSGGAFSISESTRQKRRQQAKRARLTARVSDMDIGAFIALAVAEDTVINIGESR